VNDRLLRRGWRLGSESFVARLSDRLTGRLTENHRAEERIATAEAKAELIIAAGLREIGWTETELRERNKCAPEKVRIARRIRAETTLTLKTVAARLNMGKWTTAANELYKSRKLQS
jgi:AraC-like DNA-binding protein